ncbi:hypothetical protein TYRP_007173 [Tyrophagus putrescentiae]|nr:hypothetical protein TYRP_007173 [Tyrophagus putrescentiae]
MDKGNRSIRGYHSLNRTLVADFGRGQSSSADEDDVSTAGPVPWYSIDWPLADWTGDSSAPAP